MRQGEATLEVASVDATLARLHALTREAGGYTTRETRSRDISAGEPGPGRVSRPRRQARFVDGRPEVTRHPREPHPVGERRHRGVLRPRDATAQRARARNASARADRAADQQAARISSRWNASWHACAGKSTRWRDAGGSGTTASRFSALSVSVHEPVPTVGGWAGWGVVRAPQGVRRLGEQLRVGRRRNHRADGRTGA